MDFHPVRPEDAEIPSDRHSHSDTSCKKLIPCYRDDIPFGGKRIRCRSLTSQLHNLRTIKEDGVYGLQIQAADLAEEG